MEPDPTPTAADTAAATYLRRHLRFGWWSLLCFLTLGIVLESLHGFKVGWYLDAAHSTRRLMWTLAHAHGVCFRWFTWPLRRPCPIWRQTRCDWPVWLRPV